MSTPNPDDKGLPSGGDDNEEVQLEQVEDKQTSTETGKPQEGSNETKDDAPTGDSGVDGQSDGETPDDDAELDTSAWGDTGDEVANSTLQILQNSGVTPAEAKALLWDAVAAGDPTKIDRDALVEKVGKAKATLILAGVENVTSRNNAKLAEVTKTVHEVAGGEDNWNKARDWAKKNIPEKDLQEIRELLDRGGRFAKAAVQDIVERYNSDENNTSLNAGKQITPSGKGGTKLKPLSQREYGLELDRAYNRGELTDAKRAELNQRRKLGKQRGL